MVEGRVGLETRSHWGVNDLVHKTNTVLFFITEGVASQTFCDGGGEEGKGRMRRGRDGTGGVRE